MRSSSVTSLDGGLGLKAYIAYVRWVPDIVVTRDGNGFVAFSGVL
jgi:hypothetical protein